MQCPMQQLAKLEKTTAQSSTAQPKALTKRERLVAVGISLQHPYGQASGLNTVFSLELAHPTGRINYLLLARIEWVAGGANFYTEITTQGRPCIKGVATSTGDLDCFVSRVYLRFHVTFSETLLASLWPLLGTRDVM